MTNIELYNKYRLYKTVLSLFRQWLMLQRLGLIFKFFIFTPLTKGHSRFFHIFFIILLSRWRIQHSRCVMLRWHVTISFLFSSEMTRNNFFPFFSVLPYLYACFFYKSHTLLYVRECISRARQVSRRKNWCMPTPNIVYNECASRNCIIDASNNRRKMVGHCHLLGSSVFLSSWVSIFGRVRQYSIEFIFQF